jgi:hypothetical protein
MARWFRRRRKRLYSLSGDVADAGRGLIVVAGLIISILAVALAAGHHPSSKWLAIAGMVGGLGLVLAALGWGGQRVSRVEYVTAAHAETLRRSADELLITAGAGKVAAYGFGYKTREAFHAHYKTTAASLDDFDAALTADVEARSALRERLDNEARTVEWNENEGRWKNADWSGQVYTWLLGGAHEGEWASIFERVSPQERPLLAMRDDGESDEDYEARAGRNIARMRALALAAKDWPETTSVAGTHARLAAFERDQQLTVIEALIHIREQGRIPEAKGCPVCEDEPQ